MSQLEIALAVIGATVLLIGLFSQRIKKSLVQEPLLAVGVGALAGPYGFGWLDVQAWGQPDALLERVAEATLAIALMAVALRLTPGALRSLWRPVVLLLTAGMLTMWAASSLLAGWLLGLPLALALLLGAAITPTDPVVASSIVTGPFAERHLPERVRASLSLESGANDGLAYAFIMLPILTLSGTVGTAWQRWMIDTLVIGLVVAALIGAAIGYCAERVLHWATKRHLMESYSFLTFTVTLSLFTLGIASLIGTNALVAVFTAGLVFNLYSNTGERHEEERIQEAFSKLFLLPMFVVFGVALPWDAWPGMGWPLVALIVLTLLLRRLPMMALLYPALRRSYTVRDAAFIGWFGPIGVAAIYYALFAVRHTGDAGIWHATSAIVLASILVHGVTAMPFSRWYASGEASAQRRVIDREGSDRSPSQNS
jgi:sodium/hydrogen antiporter